jgi:hypothetical protein
MKLLKAFNWSGQHLPKNPLHNDLYIVEFPKSGITWFSRVVANYMILSRSEGQNHFNLPDRFFLNDLIPDIHMSRSLAIDRQGLWPGFRVIKSHSEGNGDYLKVIYVVRHPLAVMSSYYDYRCGLGHFSGSLAEFIRHPKLGIRAWNEHVRSWIYKTHATQRIAVLKYEDLRDNAGAVVRECFANFGTSMDEALLSRALDACTFEKMQTGEHLARTMDLRARFGRFAEFKFVNQGRQAADVTLSAPDHTYIREICGATAEGLGYKL